MLLIEEEVKRQLEATGQLVLPGASSPEEILRGKRKRKFWFMKKIGDQLRLKTEGVTSA